MASCVVCTALASIYCTQDRAFLCLGCDKTIHGANVISRMHKRLPVCELCKRSAAAVYCNEDAAALCTGCNAEVHSANPLPHTVVPIDAALASGLATLPPHAAASVPPAPLTGPSKPPACDHQHHRADDEVSACGPALEACGHSEGNTSLAVVPDLAAPAPGNAPKEAQPWGKAFEALDFEAAWLGNLDMDFGDLLGNEGMGPGVGLDDDAPGMVPSFPTAAPGAEIKRASHNSSSKTPSAPSAFMLDIAPSNSADVLEPIGDEHDFAVPCFLPEDLMNDVASPDAIAGLAEPSLRLAKRPAADQLQRASRPTKAFARSEMTSSAEMYEQPTRKASQVQAVNLSGANLTREQRVARYREKRKTRKFQKTIRYASRKAYAEVRPRIKGRFATKEEVAAWKARKAAGIMNPDDDLMIFS